MKKLATLAGLAGILAASSMAATSAHSSASVTLTINPYLAVTAGALSVSGSGSYNNAGITALSGTGNYSVVANENWTSAVTTSWTLPSGVTLNTPVLSMPSGGTGIFNETGGVSVSGSATLAAGTFSNDNLGTYTITISGN